MKILISGFEPFGKEKINPTQKLIATISERKYDLGDVETILLPVTVKEAGEMLKEKLDEVNPDYLISFGLYGGITHLSLERIGVNLVDARIPDNNGEQPVDLVIDKTGAAAYWTTLPIRAMEKALKEAMIPVRVSYTAGTYICNFIMYTALNHIAKKDLKTKSGFIHVPFIREQCVEFPKRPFMEFETILKGFEVVLSALKTE
ncbi:MAG TPA: pyroglutamyl-peptidase I [Thermotogota bacterium]|nr:pyroglutamyl-peptidase I [Thermotogota bacterium]HPJ89609.1 pyroglutamyl-peptidase I [Thermotogota bacterium]HPR96792.1 pyroglutamyl-peptidase I [Thermotogota bacterium]